MRILLPVLAGVLAFVHGKYTLPVNYILPVTLAGVIAVIIAGWYREKYALRFIPGVMMTLLWFAAGYLIAQNYFQLNHTSHFSHYDTTGTYLSVRITEPVQVKEKSLQIVGQVDYIIQEQKVSRVKGKILIWLAKDSLALNVNYGDIITVPGRYSEVKDPLNPAAFNYRKYLQGKNIYHQAYFGQGEWINSNRNEGNQLKMRMLDLRQRAYSILQSNNIKGEEFAVACALMLGERDYLDEDMQREFAGAGAMHILCVSGLHVGIIYMFMNLLLGFIRGTTGRFVKMGVMLLVIWLYAALTGLAPSVMRAGIMFTFLTIGHTFSRSSNTYNILAASALLMILANPFIISDVGFQLSYFAVAGILSIHPLLYKGLYFKNRILQAAWALMSISIAAQLATAPLSVYYFHQFPSYFLITNLIVVPLTGVIIKSGILLFLASIIPFVGHYLGIAISWMIFILHSSVDLIESLPGSVIRNISLDIWQTVFIMTGSILMVFFLSLKRKLILYGIFGMMMLLGISFSLRAVALHNDTKLVVYHVSGRTAVDIIVGDKLFFYGKNNIIDRDFRNHIHPYRMSIGLGDNHPVFFTEGQNYSCSRIIQKGNFICTCGKLIRIVDDLESKSSGIPFPGEIQYIIVGGNISVTASELVQQNGKCTVIFDSSNSLYKSRQWKQECDSLGLNCWSVRLQGAFVTQL